MIRKRQRLNGNGNGNGNGPKGLRYVARVLSIRDRRDPRHRTLTLLRVVVGQDARSAVKGTVSVKLRNQRRWFQALAHTEEDFEDFDELAPKEGETEDGLRGTVGGSSAHSHSTSSLQNFLAELDEEMDAAVAPDVDAGAQGSSAAEESLGAAETGEGNRAVGSKGPLERRIGETSPAVSELRALHRLVTARYEEVFSRIKHSPSPGQSERRRRLRGRDGATVARSPTSGGIAAPTGVRARGTREQASDARARAGSKSAHASRRRSWQGAEQAGGLSGPSKEAASAATSGKTGVAGSGRPSARPSSQRQQIRTPSGRRSKGGRAKEVAQRPRSTRARVAVGNGTAMQSRPAQTKTSPAIKDVPAGGGRTAGDITDGRASHPSHNRGGMQHGSGSTLPRSGSFATSVAPHLKSGDIPMPIETGALCAAPCPGDRASKSTTSSPNSSTSSVHLSATRHARDGSAASTCGKGSVSGSAADLGESARKVEALQPNAAQAARATQSSATASAGRSADGIVEEAPPRSSTAATKERSRQPRERTSSSDSGTSRHAAINPFGKIIGDVNALSKSTGTSRSPSLVSGSATASIENSREDDSRNGSRDSSAMDARGVSYEGASSLGLSLASNEASLTSIDTQTRPQEPLDLSRSGEFSERGVSSESSLARKRSRETLPKAGSVDRDTAASAPPAPPADPAGSAKATPKARNPFAHLTQDVS
eukprot:scaffold838_cov251-Pinguiococcus_pyrenoidosus.AAC.6